LVLIHLEIGAVNIIFKFISIFIYQCFWVMGIHSKSP
jgi:hypothetical protein